MLTGSTLKVPLADLHAQYLTLKPEIDAAIQDVINSSQFILGGAVASFEQAFAEAHGASHCIGVGSGTDALHLALWASGAGRGDEVVTTPFTFIATVEAILLLGARSRKARGVPPPAEEQNGPRHHSGSSLRVTRGDGCHRNARTAGRVRRHRGCLPGASRPVWREGCGQFRIVGLL